MSQEKNDCAIFVAGSPRSGTTLVTALLDDHPQLLVFPEECLYLRPTMESIGESQNVVNTLLSDKVRNRLQGLPNLIDEVTEDRKNYLGLDYHLFETKANERFQILKEQKENKISLPSLGLVSLIDGYKVAFGRTKYSRWVVKNPKYELHWRQLFTDFPDAKIILMLRDPRKVILSRILQKSKKRYVKAGGIGSQWKPDPETLKPRIKFFKDWQRSVSAFYRISQVFPKQILLIRYEDLVTKTEIVMQEVSDFLEIQWNESLLVPSFLGTPWEGNSIHPRKFNRVDSSETRKIHNLEPHHLWQTEAWIGQTMFGGLGQYPPSGALRKIDMKAFFVRLPDEGTLEFLQNRLRMWLNWRQLSRSQSAV
jgi:hypothetical protein